MAGLRPYTGRIVPDPTGGPTVPIAKRQGIAVLLCLLLLGTGCSGGGSKKDAATSKSGGTGANDINPTDRDDLADGGKLT